MSSRTLTGLLLIVGSVVTSAGILPVIASIGNVDQRDVAAVISGLAENQGVVKFGFSLSTLGMVMVAAGWLGLNHSMSGGSGAHYMRPGLLLYIMGATVVVAEMALGPGTAEATAAGDQAAAEGLYATSRATGAFGEATRFLGFALMGFAILTQRNLHAALGGLMIPIGLIGVVVAVSDYSSPLLLIGYIGAMVLSIAAGVLYLRAKPD